MNPCGDLQSLADRAVALGPEHGRTKELMGWAVGEIERLRGLLGKYPERAQLCHDGHEPIVHFSDCPICVDEDLSLKASRISISARRHASWCRAYITNEREPCECRAWK